MCSPKVIMYQTIHQIQIFQNKFFMGLTNLLLLLPTNKVNNMDAYNFYMK